ncbi:hypothetical protein [Streptomyces sp. TRM68367]|uniref:hypothetical protein n=1 Tax=Streptomyces sp. TRM68367 TaxID=2758415 RepID=UPI0021D20FBB|nr:hypothetical protein [Streptomyces sp. TRM68367]
MHKSTFGKLKLWIMSVVGVLLLALTVQLTTQSASAAPVAVESSNEGDVVEIHSTDDGINLVTDFAEIERDHTVDRSNADLDAKFDDLNERMSDLGWDLTQSEERQRLEQEASSLLTFLDPVADDATGSETGTDLGQLQQVLAQVENGNVCEGRCLSTPGEKAARTVIFAAIAAVGTLGLAATGVISIPSAAVGLAVAAIITTARVYYEMRDNIDELPNALQRQMANNAMFAGMDVLIRNYDAVRAEQDVIIDDFLNNLADDVEAARGEELAVDNNIDLMDGEL